VNPKPVRPNQLNITLGLTKYALLATLRNKTALFFSLIFPMAFILVFGLIGNSTNQIKLGITADFNHQSPVYVAIKAIADTKDSPITLEEGNKTDLEKKLSQSNLAAVIEPPTSTSLGLTLTTSNSNPAGQAEAESIVGGVLSQLNLQSAHVVNPPFKSDAREISGKVYRYIDFALPGQIGFSLLSLATFGVAFSFITLRRTLVLKRLFATNVTPLSFVLSQCLSRAVQAIIQVLIIIAVGVKFFHFDLPYGWWTVAEMLLISLIGVFSFLGFGMLISGIAKDEQSAPLAINLFNLPQMLLAGVFFSIDGMPKWVQFIGNNLPLAYFNIAMRKVTTEGLSIVAVWPYLGGMLVWSLVAYFLAAKTFKSE